MPRYTPMSGGIVFSQPIQVVVVGNDARIERMVGIFKSSLLQYIPRWASVVYLEFAGDSMDAYACVIVHEEYRSIYIKLYSGLGMESDHDIRRVLLHELMHAYVAPVQEVARQAIRQLGDESPVAAMLTAALDHAVERSTCDLEHMVVMSMETYLPLADLRAATAKNHNQSHDLPKRDPD